MNVSKKLFASVLCLFLLMSCQPAKCSTGRTLLSLGGYAASFGLLWVGMEMNFQAGMGKEKDGENSFAWSLGTPVSFFLHIGSVGCASLATYIWASEGKKKEDLKFVGYARRDRYYDDEDTLRSSRNKHRT